MYRIVISRLAGKELRQLPHDVISKIHSKIAALTDNPRPSGVVKLITFENLWRIRVGTYRVIYSIDDKEQIIDIRRIVDRKDAY